MLFYYTNLQPPHTQKSDLKQNCITCKKALVYVDDKDHGECLSCYIKRTKPHRCNTCNKPIKPEYTQCYDCHAGGGYT